VNERNLSRTLSTNIVDALKAQGHILVVKGGALALARELEDLMSPRIAEILPGIQPVSLVGGEVTSTFGHEVIDETVEEIVSNLTRVLMDSDHVEDVFAEDNVIRRDIFRALRDGLLRPVQDSSPGADEPAVRVELDTLGYIAATVSKLATPKALREALSRAAEMAMAAFMAYQPEDRVATFVLQDDDPDGRLELEEAIADELTTLVQEGTVDLPTIERRVDLGRALAPAEQRAARAWIDAAGKHALLGAGCVAAWELDGGRAIRLTFTPLSDQDAQDVEQHLAAFARELAQSRGPAGVTPRPLPGEASRESSRAPSPAVFGQRPALTRGGPDLDFDDGDDDLDDDEDNLDDEDLDDDDEAREDEGDEARRANPKAAPAKAPRSPKTTTITTSPSAVKDAKATAKGAKATAKDAKATAKGAKATAKDANGAKKRAAKRMSPTRASERSSPEKADKRAGARTTKAAAKAEVTANTASPRKSASTAKAATRPAAEKSRATKAPAKKR
jgi:hypothetical protein